MPLNVRPIALAGGAITLALWAIYCSDSTPPNASHGGASGESDSAPDIRYAPERDVGGDEPRATGALEWSPIPETAAGCEVLRLSNPESVRAFTWEPCEGLAGCEKATFDGRL